MAEKLKKPIGKFSDLGRIAFETFKMKADNQGMAITGIGPRKSMQGLARIVMGMSFVYYKYALTKLQNEEKLPDDFADLELRDLMEIVESL